MNTVQEALGLALAMGAVILFCRAFPFLFASGGKAKKSDTAPSLKEKFFTFVEKIVPPVAMTVLAFNALGGAFREDIRGGLLGLCAAAFTALAQVLKRNALISIFGGTALYMILLALSGGV